MIRSNSLLTQAVQEYEDFSDSLEWTVDNVNKKCYMYNEHQEIKTRINHNTPNCNSYQKVKNVLNDRHL